MSARTVLSGCASMAVILFAPDGAWWLALHFVAGFVMGGMIAKAARFDAMEAK